MALYLGSTKINSITVEKRFNLQEKIINKNGTYSYDEGYQGLSSVTINISPSPTDNAGLCFWLDGDCNTRQGLDRSKNYFENLVWIPPLNQSAGNIERWKPENSSTWNNLKPNMLNIGANALFSDLFCSDRMTLEVVFMFTSIPSTYTNIINTNTDSGYNFAVYNDGANIGIIDSDGWNTSTSLSWKNNEINTPHYLCATFNCNNGKCTIQQDTNNVVQTTLNNIIQRSTSGVSSGIFGNNTTNSTIMPSIKYDSIAVGMIRAWTRVLSENEIARNYQDAINRFDCI